MKRMVVGLVLVALALGGCASAPGQLNGLGGDVMGYMVVYRTDDGALTQKEYDAVARVAEKMSARVSVQLSSPAEAGLATGGLSAFGGAIDRVSGSYGVLGVLTGLSAYSYAVVYAIAEATENALRDRESAGEGIFHMVHVTAAFVRSLNTSESSVPSRK